jgi:uncharacterized protein YfaS (alpha-2-macroglobulin family)
MLLFLTAKAQDTLILNNGEEMYIKVIEVGENAISYKKQQNLNGPIYSTDISKIFMAVYKNGKRETFSKQNPTSTSNASGALDEDKVKAVINDNNFEVHLISTKAVPDKKNKHIIITADIDAYAGGKFFTKMSLLTTQAKDIKNSGASTISINIISEKLQTFLWEKYENYAGKGYRWDLPAHFFSLDTSSCSIKFYTQKSGNKEILGFGGLSYTVLNLKNCASLENKLLSVALVWLETNFSK